MWCKNGHRWSYDVTGKPIVAADDHYRRGLNVNLPKSTAEWNALLSKVSKPHGQA
jgi:hypothetical protein